MIQRDQKTAAEPGVATQLGRWISTSRIETFPDEVVQKTISSLTDTLGVALAGRTHPASSTIIDVIQSLGGSPQAHVIGTDLYTSSTQAALANAYLAHVLDFDDTHSQVIAHVSAPVSGAALAAAQAAEACGADVLAAQTVGLEVCSRIAVAMNGRDDHGWHLTGVAGTIGAAAAASRAFGLAPDQSTAALGIASTMTSGMRVHRGTGAKSMSPAHAASSGVLAAVSARAGMTSNPEFFEHPHHAFFHTLGFDADLDSVVADLGTEYSMLRLAAKPYPCGVTSHPAIDATADLMDQLQSYKTGNEISEVTVQVHPLALELTGNPAPQSGLEAKFSVAYAVAVTLIDRHISIDAFTDEAVQRSDVQALLSRINVESDAALTRQQAALTVEWCSGESHVQRSSARGSDDRPLSQADLRRKFMTLNADRLGQSRCEAILDQLGSLATAPSLEPLLRTLRSDLPG